MRLIGTEIAYAYKGARILGIRVMADPKGNLRHIKAQADWGNSEVREIAWEEMHEVYPHQGEHPFLMQLEGMAHPIITLGHSGNWVTFVFPADFMQAQRQPTYPLPLYEIRVQDLLYVVQGEESRFLREHLKGIPPPEQRSLSPVHTVSGAAFPEGLSVANLQRKLGKLTQLTSRMASEFKGASCSELMSFEL